MLAASPKISNVRASHWHESTPVGGPSGQQAFLNGAVRFDTDLSPEELLDVLQSVEGRLGRVRGQRWAARPIDLDLLLYGEETIHTPRLTVPHPRMAFRRFVVEPAAEVAAEMRHPTIGWTVRQLLAHLDADPAYVALSGPPASGKTALAAQAALGSGARLITDPAAGMPAAPLGDSPSRLLERQIQFLDRRRAVLDRTTWPGGAPWRLATFTSTRHWFTPVESWTRRFSRFFVEPGSRPKSTSCGPHSWLCSTSRIRRTTRPAGANRRSLDRAARRARWPRGWQTWQREPT